MAADDCIRSIEEAAGRKLGDDEAISLISAVRARQQLVMARNKAIDARTAALQAAEEVGDRLDIAATIEKRNAAMNMAKRIERVQWIRENFGHNLAEGLEAMLVGVNRAKEGARQGVAQLQESLKQTYLGGLVTDLERSGNMALLASGSMDRDVARALWLLDGGQAPKPEQLSTQARAAQEAFDRYRSSGRPLADFLNEADLDPAARNLVLGLDENKSNPAASARLLADFSSASQRSNSAPMDLAADVVEAARRGDRVSGAMGGLPKQAIDIAKVIAQWQATARADANEAGAWIRSAQNYITRQSHDPLKVRGDGSPGAFEAWRSEALHSFDLERMAADNSTESIDDMLRAIWADLASGTHLKAVPEDELAGFTGPSNVAKKVSQSRVIYFKTADGWFDYNQSFGTGNLRESVVAALSHHAETTGLMRNLGTNPGAMFDTIKNDLIQQALAEGKAELVAKLRDKEGRLSNFMAVVDGSMNVPGNALWARRMANVRTFETLAKLGGMVLSQLNDVAVYAAGTRYQGRGFFTGIGEAVGGLGRNLGEAETRQLAGSLGVTLDNMASEIGRAGAFAESGSLSRATQLFMKLNLSQWWQNHMRASAAMGLSHDLAQQAGRQFGELHPDFQRLFGTYSITPAKWDAIRSIAQTHVDGKAYVVPEKLSQVPESVLDAHAKELGLKGPERIEQARRDIEQSLRNYLVDQTQFLALEPDKRTKAILLQGTRPGTVNGEFFRFMLQFKSFTGAYMTKVLGRELFGRGYEGDSVLGALRNGNGEMQGLVSLIVTSTLAGYGSMALKDLAKGRTPRDPTDSPGDAWKILLAAMVQGGGAGIYGDFLFGQASRAGSGTIESLAGPVISTGGRIFDLYHRALAGDDVAARAMNEALNNTPFANLFYTRTALNYLLLYRVQEQMNPGYLRRMEREAERNNAQGFLLRPSEAIQ